VSAVTARTVGRLGAAPLLAVLLLGRLALSAGAFHLRAVDILPLLLLVVTALGLLRLRRWGWILAHLGLGLAVPAVYLNAARMTAVETVGFVVAAAALLLALGWPAVQGEFGVSSGYRLVLGIAVSDLFLILILRQLDPLHVWREMTSIGYGALWRIPAIGIYFAGIWVRTARWGLLLRPIKRCTTARLFPIYIISYMANNVLPFRMGDLYRAYIAGKKESISKAAALTTVAVERVFDGLTMLLFLVITSLFFPFPAAIRKTLRVGGVGFLGVLAVCYLMLWQQEKARRLLARVVGRLPENLAGRLMRLADAVFDGMIALKGPREMIGVNVYSILTWGLEALMYHLTLLAFGYQPPFYISLTTLAVVNLFIIVPGPPGYFGPFEYACVLVLGLPQVGIPKEVAMAYALILHVVGQWIPSTALGLVFMWREHVSFHEVEASQREPRPVAEGAAG